jgi:DNA-directed RNA polymerase subunit RPC12/RpoP
VTLKCTKCGADVQFGRFWLGGNLKCKHCGQNVSLEFRSKMIPLLLYLVPVTFLIWKTKGFPVLAVLLALAFFSGVGVLLHNVRWLVRAVPVKEDD